MTGERAVSVDVRSMFDRIAGRYRLMNRLITFGQDGAWRRLAVGEAALPAGGRLLDAATGTGDIALEALRRTEGLTAVGADFSLEMMLLLFSVQGSPNPRFMFMQLILWWRERISVLNGHLLRI